MHERNAKIRTRAPSQTRAAAANRMRDLRPKPTHGLHFMRTQDAGRAAGADHMAAPARAMTSAICKLLVALVVKLRHGCLEGLALSGVLGRFLRGTPGGFKVVA